MAPRAPASWRHGGRPAIYYLTPSLKQKKMFEKKRKKKKSSISDNHRGWMIHSVHFNQPERKLRERNEGFDSTVEMERRGEKWRRPRLRLLFIPAAAASLCVSIDTRSGAASG